MRCLCAAAVVLMTVVAGPAPGQYKARRAADGKPDLNGIWQAIGTAHWDLEGHAARPGPVVALGAVGAVPAGLGVVEGGEIPYLSSTLEKRNENRKNWLTLDPEIKCFM
ncbi:MAG: hypothetical protein ACRD96_00570, partial [Bryobacteraceae bacterium]